MQIFQKTMITMLLTGAAMLTLGGASQADVTVTETTTIDSPQLRAMLKQMPPEQRAMVARMGGPMSGMLSGQPTAMTIYVSGDRSRADVGALSVISSASSRKTTVLNRQTKTFTTQTNGAAAGAAMNGARAQVKDTGKTRTILGYPARLYHVTLSNITTPQTGAAPMNMAMDIWATKSLPSVAGATPALPGPAGMAQAQMKRIQGLPLLSVVSLTGGPTGPVKITTAVKSVKKTLIPASAFAVPAGYKPAPTPTPMTGG